MSLRLVVILLLFAVVCCGGNGLSSNKLENGHDGSLQPEKHFSQRSTSKPISAEGVLDGLAEENSETGSSLLDVEIDGSGLGEYLPSPGEVQLQFINISSVLLTWSYHFGETPPQVEFIVQCSHNGEPYINCSSLLNSTCYVYSGLEYADYYQFRMLAYRLGLASEPKETYYFVNGITAPPGPPTDVKARAVSHNEINLQWEGPATPTPLHYIVKWGTKLALLDMTVEVYESVHYTFTSLHVTPGKMYYFQIIADISGRLSIPTSIVNASTPISALPPVQLQCDFIVSSRWAYLSWTSPVVRYPLEVTNFTVYYSKRDENPLSGQSEIETDMFHSRWTVDADLLNATITELDPATVYIFCVGYSSGEFLSELSVPLELVTLDGVSCYVCEALSSTELLLKWKYFGSSEASISKVFVSELPDLKQIAVFRVNVSGDYQYTVSGLNPWSSHMFAIALDTSMMVYDQCPFNDCMTEEAAPCEPPTNVTIAEITAQTITVTWDAPPAGSHNGIIQDYVVVPADSKHMNSKLTGLSPFSECSIEIAARTGRGGYGPFSFKISVTTNEDVPSGLPTNVALLKTTDRSLALSWGPPSSCQQNGNISGYTVYITEYVQPSVNFHYARRSLIINVSETTVIVEPLTADTLYGISVAARTGAGLGPCSLPLNATTIESDGSTMHWKVVPIIMVCAVVLIVLSVAACLLKWLTYASSPPLISMDNYSPTQLVQNDCITYSNTTDVEQNSSQQEDFKTHNKNVLRHSYSVEALSRPLPAVPKRNGFEECSNDDYCTSSPLHQFHECANTHCGRDGCSMCRVSTQSSLQIDNM